MIMIVNSCINYLWSLEIREVARHWIGHVGAAEAIWKMRCSVNSASRHVTLQLTYFVMSVLSVKKVVSSAAECPILASMRNQYWLWFLQESRAWVARLEKYSFPSWKWYSCVCYCGLYTIWCCWTCFATFFSPILLKRASCLFEFGINKNIKHHYIFSLFSYYCSVLYMLYVYICLLWSMHNYLVQWTEWTKIYYEGRGVPVWFCTSVWKPAT
jgi:hypothetical protein